MSKLVFIIFCFISLVESFIVWKAPQELYPSTNREMEENSLTKLPLKTRLSLLQSGTDDAIESLRAIAKKDYPVKTLRKYNPTCFFSALPCFPKKGYFYVRLQRKNKE